MGELQGLREKIREIVASWNKTHNKNDPSSRVAISSNIAAALNPLILTHLSHLNLNRLSEDEFHCACASAVACAVMQCSPSILFDRSKTPRLGPVKEQQIRANLAMTVFVNLLFIQGSVLLSGKMTDITRTSFSMSIESGVIPDVCSVYLAANLMGQLYNQENTNIRSVWGRVLLFLGRES